MTIRLLIADDHDLVRTGLVAMLSATDGIEVVGEAACGQACVRLARDLLPDVVLLDVNMPNMNGIDATKKLITLDGVKVLALSANHAPPFPSLLVKAGARGYITKGAPLPEMIAAITNVAKGARYFSQEVMASLAENLVQNDNPFDALSERERQVALLVVNGANATDIATQLFVSPKTVNTYRYRIFEKLGVDSDVKLTHLAVRYGLLDLS